MLEDPLAKYAEALAEDDPYTATLAARLNGVQPLTEGEEESGSKQAVLWPRCWRPPCRQSSDYKRETPRGCTVTKRRRRWI